LQEQLSSNNTVGDPFLTVNGTLTLTGNLTVSFDEHPTHFNQVRWLVFKATKIAGAPLYVKAAVAESSSFSIDWPVSCFSFVTGSEAGRENNEDVLFVSTRFVNDCKDALENHPVRAALIAIGTIGVVFTAFALLIMWRKRRFDQRRRSMLASRIDLESSDAELEVLLFSCCCFALKCVLFVVFRWQTLRNATRAMPLPPSSSSSAEKPDSK
jgi:hypothetical protein